MIRVTMITQKIEKDELILSKRLSDIVAVGIEQEVRVEPANLPKKNADMSFKTRTMMPKLIIKSPLTFNNILNNKHNSTDNNTNIRDSSSCFHCFKEGEEKVENEKKRKWRGRKLEGIETRRNSYLSLISQGHYYNRDQQASFLSLHQFILLTSLAFLALLDTRQMLTVCFAQKLVYGKSHNPLLQQPTNIVIPHIKYGQGLNRWSFLSVDRDNHGLHSDLLCPNPMMTTSSFAVSGYNNRGGSGITSRVNPGRGNKQQQPQTHQQQTYPQSRFPGGQIGSASYPGSQHHPAPLPNEIWALKTDEQMSLLPCSLRQYAVPPPFSSPTGGGNSGMVLMNRGGGGARGGGTAGRHNSGHFIENRILYVNVSLVPFNFHGAIPCSKYIKLMYDEEEGTNLRCGDIPFDPRHDNKYHINWPPRPKRKEYFSLLDNLERFLQNEQTLIRQFYFQFYFTSQINGRSKRCTVQQYELDLSYPAGNARFCNLSNSNTGTGGHEELCGEFHCDDLIFPLYTDPQPNTNGHHDHPGKGGGRHNMGSSMEDDYEDDYDDEMEDTSMEDNNLRGGKHSKGGSSSLDQTHEGRDQQDQDHQGFSWTRMIRMDMRFLIFVTIVPLVLFGVLVFGLELIVHFMCCRKRRDEDDEGGGTRSQQLLENSLNVWENVPSRMDAQRTVSFSPMTTSIYGDRKNNHLQMMDAASLESHPETPKILKSALKAAKPGDHGSPTTAAHHYFDYHHDHDMPPSYIETTAR